MERRVEKSTTTSTTTTADPSHRGLGLVHEHLQVLVARHEDAVGAAADLQCAACEATSRETTVDKQLRDRGSGGRQEARRSCGRAAIAQGSAHAKRYTRWALASRREDPTWTSGSCKWKTHPRSGARTCSARPTGRSSRPPSARTPVVVQQPSNAAADNVSKHAATGKQATSTHCGREHNTQHAASRDSRTNRLNRHRHTKQRENDARRSKQ